MQAAPTAAALTALTGLRVLFGHQSVGDSILAALPRLYSDRAAAPTIVETRTAPEAAGYLAHAHVGENADPLAKLEDFASLVDGPFAGRLDVALVKFCYVDVDSRTDAPALVAGYATCLQRLQAEHPDTTFLAATVPLTTDLSWKGRIKLLLGRDDHRGPADNLARHRFNTLLRSAYQPKGLLFDIAAAESGAAGRTAVRQLRGEEYHVLRSELSSDAGHLNPAGALAAAAALVAAVTAARVRR